MRTALLWASRLDEPWQRLVKSEGPFFLTFKFCQIMRKKDDIFHILFWVPPSLSFVSFQKISPFDFFILFANDELRRWELIHILGHLIIINLRLYTRINALERPERSMFRSCCYSFVLIDFESFSYCRDKGLVKIQTGEWNINL